MDPEFQRALVVVLIAGGAVAVIGTTVLFLAFRRFGTAGAGSARPFGLLGALVAFVFLCCLVLFMLSYAER